ncbi:MAG: hypothetical protein P8X82_06755, partial [Gemmatimonadales bacterium]
MAVGEVAAAEVIAPFEFVVPKTQEEIARQTAAVEATLRPIYEIDQAAVEAAIAAADLVFGALDTTTTVEGMVSAAESVDLQLSEDQAEYLLADGLVEAFANGVKNMMRRHLPKGVPDAGFLQIQQAREIVVRRGDSESIVSRDSVYTFERFLDSRVTVHPDPTSDTGDNVLVIMISRVFRPTLVFNRAETEQVRLDLRASVSTVRDTVRENERIVDANQVVTPEIRERLDALNNEWIARGRTEGDISATVGQILTNALLLALFWLLLMLFVPHTYASIRKMLAIAIMFALVIIGAAANVGAAGNLRFL